MAAFGFSVGDFLAATALVLQATQALRASSTATAECQQAALFLDSVHHILRRVIDLMRKDEDLEPYRHAFAVADFCRKQVVESLERYRKYEERLVDDGSDSRPARQRVERMLVKNKMKLKWVFVSKEGLRQLSAALSPQLQVLQLSLQAVECQKTTAMAEQQDSMLAMTRALYARIEMSVARVEPDTVAGAERDNELRCTEAVVQQVRVPGERSAVPNRRAPFPLFPPHPGMKSGIDASVTTEQVISILVLYLWQSLYQFVRAMTSMPMRPTFLLDSNIQLQEALGRSLSLPYEHFRHWPVLLARLDVAFDVCPGQLKVLRSSFAIFTISKPGSERVVRRLDESNWETSVRQGDKLVMSMSIEGQGHRLDECPRCRTVSEDAGQLGWSTW
ncbi:hypothetical protein B0A55_09865 [Friedmanniomyces simplex]|uniref:Ubiquitin-like domain-containing protein n=1 Tax=Friedmanniomyces simplex TaxID=329884 RepID=A0A4U0WRJ0_9PEZI|nr:hypothetical protein B0A55_09865 [Friedmanniomyces simplex]